MSEERGAYLLKDEAKPDMLEPESLRTQLEEVERRLVPLLIAVQRALGKEPSITTRSERRAR